MIYKAHLIYKGNVQDIKTSLEFHSDITIKELNLEIEAEKNGYNRSTIIKLFESRIRKILKTKSNG